MTKVAYGAAHVLVRADEPARADSAVLVEGDHIVAVVGLREIPGGYSLIDLGQAWLMPGLIDMHVHLVWDGSADPGRARLAESAELTTLKVPDGRKSTSGTGSRPSATVALRTRSCSPSGTPSTPACWSERACWPPGRSSASPTPATE
jgi:hypothetical protein